VFYVVEIPYELFVICENLDQEVTSSLVWRIQELGGLDKETIIKSIAVSC
jgi:hypothetical protein